MLLSFDKCIEAIAETLVTREFPLSRQAEKSGDIAAFLLEVHSRMPDYLRLVFRILTLVFDAWPYPMTGKPFHRLSLARRSDQLDRWEHSRLQSRHGLIAFYRTLAIFGLYSELYKQDDGV
jgi:hypothetical protein